MSEKEQEAKMKEFNENVMKKFIEKHMDKPYEEVDSREIAASKPHEKIDRNVRMAIAKWIRKEFEENGELNDLHFKAAVTAGLIVGGAEP